MNCSFCGSEAVTKNLSGNEVCEKCFSQISQLRAGKSMAIAYFSKEENLSNATEDAKKYIESFLEKGKEVLAQIEEEKAQKEKISEIERQKVLQAKALNGIYEYEVVTIMNDSNGMVDRENLQRALEGHGKRGWRLHSIYSNELGKDALAVLGLGVNSTVCQDVLIFERRVE